MSKKNNLSFHFVNSVKGGSGKSTFSLLLAHHLIKKNEIAYIIDLDINGSSWKMNYRNFFKKSPSIKTAYINDLMKDLSNGLKGEFIHRLNVQTIYTSDNENHMNDVRDIIEIPLCIMDPNNPFDIDEKEIDLFENVIGKILINIIHKEIVTGKKINIIFDMPPSHEKHAERILNHLLVDRSSNIYRYFTRRKHSYDVNLYMLSSVSPAHAEANFSYIDNCFVNKSFSNCIGEFINKNDFKLYFVLNDVNALTELIPITYNKDNIEDAFWSMFSKTNIKDQVPCTYVVLLKYLKLEYYIHQLKEYISPETKPQFLMINDKTFNDFNQFIESLPCSGDK